MMPCALLIAPPGHGGEAEEALRALGTLAEPAIAPEQFADRLAQQSLVDLIAVEAATMNEDSLDTLLPLLRDLAGRFTARVVVTLDAGQIDHVAGALLGMPVSLLCQPTMPERVAALAIKRPVSPNAHDREIQTTPGEIARLSAEVERIARALASLSGQADAASDVERPSTFAPPPAPGSADVDVATVRAAIRVRRLREQFFERDLLGEPGWDILLDLFAAELEELRVSVSSLCIAAAVPPTTALRWITGMTEAGLLQRQADAADRRRAFIRLTTTASTGMRNYFAAVRRQGLSAG